MTREDPQLKLRLPPNLKTQIVESARLSGRSVNSEIIHRLEASLEAPPRPAYIHRGENVPWLKELESQAAALCDSYGVNDWPEKVEALCYEVLGTINVSEDLVEAASGVLFWLRHPDNEGNAGRRSEYLKNAENCLSILEGKLENRIEILQQRYREQIEQLKQRGVIED